MFYNDFKLYKVISKKYSAFSNTEQNIVEIVLEEIDSNITYILDIEHLNYKDNNCYCYINQKFKAKDSKKLYILNFNFILKHLNLKKLNQNSNFIIKTSMFTLKSYSLKKYIRQYKIQRIIK
jgi:hypothetical protein